MRCSSCSIEFDDDVKVCSQCGNALEAPANDVESGSYSCELCREELEYITAYKQWYCYNCQTYVDLPMPSEIAGPELESKSDTELEDVSETSLAWDDNVIDTEEDADEDSTDITDEVDNEIDFDNTLSDLGTDDEEPSDETSIEETGEEFSWDDIVEGDVEEDSGEDPEYDASTEPNIPAGSRLEEIENNENDTISHESDADEELGAEEDYDSTDDIDDDFDFEIESESDVKPESGDEDSEELIVAGPIAGVDLETDTIENLSADDVEVEIDTDYAPLEETLEISDFSQATTSTKQDTELKKKALAKLHQAWLKVNNLKGLYPNDPRVLQLEEDLKRALEGDYDPRDGIILADESIEETEKLGKELKEVIHHDISNLFHFVNSKIILAKKIGFDMESLEDELDNCSSLIARSEYHQARSELEVCLNKIFELPKTQDEIMIGLDEHSESIMDLLEPVQVKET